MKARSYGQSAIFILSKFWIARSKMINLPNLFPGKKRENFYKKNKNLIFALFTLISFLISWKQKLNIYTYTNIALSIALLIESFMTNFEVQIKKLKKWLNCAGICERSVQRACRLASEQHGEILQVHVEACAAMESGLPQHFPSLGPLLLPCSHCRFLRQVIN